MKIEKLKLKNFAQFEDFEIVFNDGVTHLIGINGSGKTTVGLTALWAGFRGIAEKSKTGALIGERYRFISEGKKSLDIEITVKDALSGKIIKLKRHITKGTNTIRITPNDDASIDREYVENLFNVSFLSATHFSALTGQQQAEAMGIDASVYDSKLILRKDEAKEYRRDIKSIGDLVPVQKVDPVNIQALQEKRAVAVNHNHRQHDNKQAYAGYKRNVQEHTEKIKQLQGLIVEAKAEMEALPAIGADQDIGAIDTQIREVTATNGQAFKYEQYQTKQTELTQLEKELEGNKVLQDTIVTERAEYLQSKTFGIKGLEIDDKGQLTKDGKLIRCPYFSKGELEVLVARIAMNLNPELKVRFIDDFELLDDKNQETLIKNLTKKGFQIITAKVGDKVTGENSVLLRECQIEGDPRQTKFKKAPAVGEPVQTDEVAEDPEESLEEDDFY